VLGRFETQRFEFGVAIAVMVGKATAREQRRAERIESLEEFFRPADSGEGDELAAAQMIGVARDEVRAEERHAADAQPGSSAIVATEVGMLYPLRQAAPEVEFIAANADASCRYMKMITLPKLRDALRDGVHEVRVADATADAARLAIERMVAIN